MTNIFILLIAFQIKHFLSDYPFQTPYMLKKFLPGWDFLKPLAAHCGVHAFFTLVISFIYTSNMNISFLTACLDFVIHFTMDRIKASPKMLGRYKALASSEFPEIQEGIANEGLGYDCDVYAKDCKSKLRGNKLFWWSLGLDQGVHHLTHYLLIYLLVTY